jgi:integral membrane sensor domain MASE1
MERRHNHTSAHSNSHHFPISDPATRRLPSFAKIGAKLIPLKHINGQEEVCMISRSGGKSFVARQVASVQSLTASAINPQNILLFLVITIAYFVSGKFGQQLAIPNPDATAFWPPAGIALAALFIKGNKALPGIFAGGFLVNLTTTGMPLIASGIAFGNMLEVMIAVFLVKKFANGVDAFFTPKGVLRFFVLAGIVPTTFCATVGIGLLCLGGVVKWSAFWDLWSVWWVGDLLGSVILAPFLILLFVHRHHSLSWTEWCEATILLAGLTAICVLNFGPPIVSWVPKLFFSIPFLFWAAIRFCPLEVSGACLLMSGFAVWGSLHGYGPYANTRTAPLMVTGYILAYSIMAMIVSAAIFQQRKQIENLYVMYYRLKSLSMPNKEVSCEEVEAVAISRSTIEE